MAEKLDFDALEQMVNTCVIGNEPRRLMLVALQRLRALESASQPGSVDSPEYERGYADGKRDARFVMLSEGFRKPETGSQPGSGEWQPIETAPKDGTRFIAWHKGHIDFFRWQADNGTGRPVGWRDSFVYVSREGDGPSHWMPLPAAPSAGNGEAKGGREE